MTDQEMIEIIATKEHDINDDLPYRCGSCGAFMRTVHWINEGSGEEESSTCYNPKCKEKK